MTLEEYYIAKSNIKVPDYLDWTERPFYINKEIEKLQKKLSDKDLEKVIQSERRWQDKMQSSVG